ncbi:MAG: hypothetical protein WC365_06165 [Candidatus Babeliales bacterium]
MSVTKEAGTGSRKQASIDSSGVYYTIDFKMKVQVLATFINVYCIPTAEGDITAASLYVTNGITSRGFTSYCNTLSVEGNQTGAIIASIQMIAIANEDKTITITNATQTPMTKAAVTTLTLGGTPITKWTKWSFGVNNNVKVISTGNGVAATEIFAQQAEYSGNITFVQTASLAYGYSTDVAKDLIITLTDNQSPTPAAKTYTFDDVRATSNEYTVSELDITYESVAWDGDELAIT